MNFTYFGIHTTNADDDDVDDDDDADDVVVAAHDELVVVAAARNRVGGKSRSATVVTHTPASALTHTHTHRDMRADGGYRKSVWQELWKAESARRVQESESECRRERERFRE